MPETAPVPIDELLLVDATVLPHSGGDMAAGSVRVAYRLPDSDSKVTFELEYDTKAGPDGLMTVVTTQPGDSVITWIKDEHTRHSVPKQAVEHAKEVFARYQHEAVTSMGPQTGVCFAGIIPVDGDDIAEIAG